MYDFKHGLVENVVRRGNRSAVPEVIKRFSCSTKLTLKIYANKSQITSNC